jgi:hypothetical protein
MDGRVDAAGGAVATVDRRWVISTFAIALLTGVVLAFVPAVRSSSCVASTAGRELCTSDTKSLLEMEGASVVFILAVPAIVALVAVAVPKRASVIGVAAVLSLAALLGIASIGTFFIPTVAVAWIAVARMSSDERRPSSEPSRP